MFFLFNDTATTEIYTLSLHDALPISSVQYPASAAGERVPLPAAALREALPVDGGSSESPRFLGLGKLRGDAVRRLDRKTTRLNSSHANISYAVFCLKKK